LVVGVGVVGVGGVVVGGGWVVESMAVAAVLFSALDEARALLRRVTSFVPR
jgi:hypothetical protein